MDGLDEIKKKEILNSIRSVKIQYIIAILGVIGAAISFIVIQQNQIKALFQHNPRISFTISESMTQQKGVIDIRDIKGAVKVHSELRAITKDVELDPGSYIFTITLGGEKLWEEPMLLQVNDNKNIVLPHFLDGKIKVFLSNGTPTPHPGEPIDLDISASGNGFLWIYQKYRPDSIRLLFPTAAQTLPESANAVFAEHPYAFPPKFGLVAGNAPGPEEYLFLVSSINEEQYADNVIKMIYQTDVEKGEIASLEKNWGLQTLLVNVTR
jgi:hypothetical protein